MKKFLKLFSVISILTTLPINVASCSSSSSRVTKNSLSKEIKNELYLQAHDPNGKYHDNVGQLKGKNFWNSSSDEVNTLIYNLLNKTIGNYFYNQLYIKRLQAMHPSDKTIDLNPADFTKTNSFNADFNNEIEQLTKNELYQEYAGDYQNSTYLENQIVTKGYEPDIESTDWYIPGTNAPIMSKDGTVPSGDIDFDADYTGAGNYKWDSNWKPNYVSNKDNKITNAISSSQVASSIKNLASNSFLKKFTATGNLDPLGYWKANFGQGGDKLKQLKTDLLHRFATYAFNEIEPTMFKKIFVENLLKQTNFIVSKVNKNYIAYPNVNSVAFTDWENWTSSKWSSNFKLVWEIKAPKGIINDPDWKDFNTAATSDPVDKTETIDTLAKFTSWFDKSSTTSHFSNNIIDALKSGDSTLGASPWLSNKIANKYFEGLFGINNGKIFTSNSTNKDISAYTNQLIDTTSRKSQSSGVLIDPTTSKPYFQGANKNQVIFVFQIPVYLMDLIGNNPNGTTPSATSGGIQYYNWTKPQSSKIDIPNEVKYVASKDYSDPSTPKDLYAQWNNTFNKYKQSSDIQGLGSVLKQSLYDEIMAQISSLGLNSDPTKDSSIAKFADQIFYSYAFDNDPKNIYTADLFNKIGQYVIARNE